MKRQFYSLSDVNNGSVIEERTYNSEADRSRAFAQLSKRPHFNLFPYYGYLYFTRPMNERERQVLAKHGRTLKTGARIYQISNK